MRELHELRFGQGSRGVRRAGTAPVQVERLEQRVVPAAPGHANAPFTGDAVALSAGGKNAESDDTWNYRIGAGNEGRSALMVAGDPNGTPPDAPDDRIDPNTADSPFAGVGVVSLVRGQNITGGGTGVAIGPRHVLTAAHVVDINHNGHHDGADWDSMEFWLNLDTDSPVDQPDVIIPVAGWFIHPDAFNPGNAFFHDDVAVIELAEPLPEGVPFYPLYAGDLAGRTLHLVGHGRSGDGVNGFTIPGSRTIKRVGQNVADRFEGQDDHRRPEAVELWQADFDHPTDASLNFLGGPSLGNDKETCVGPGDSGGPAFVLTGSNPNQASSYQIGGVITHGIKGLSALGLFGCGFGGTVVSAYLDWIRGTLAGNVLDSGGGRSSLGTGVEIGDHRGDPAASQRMSARPNSADFASSAFVASVRPSVPNHQPMTMSYRTTDRTATIHNQDDFGWGRTPTFASGEATNTITIEVKGDSTREGNEAFTLELFALGSSAMLVDGVGLGNILNSD